MKLNDTKCKNAKPLSGGSKSPNKLSDGRGLYLYVMPNGAKYWRFIYRFNGKQRLYAIGVYPEVSLKEAREKHILLRKMVSEGKDPCLEQKKQKAMAVIDNNNTFEAVARDWHEYRKEHWNKRYAAELLKRLEVDIFPHLGPIPIKEIEPPLLLQVIRKIEKRGAHEQARRQLQKCGEIFRFAIAEGRAIRDPSADIREALKPIKRDHYPSLEVKELPAFIKAIERNDARLFHSTRNALYLIMLTFVRTSELINAKWEEIDFERKEWVIPAERMKMGRKHVVPLSDQAIKILKDQQELVGHWPLVFPSSVRPKQSMSNNTILGAIKRLGYKGRMTGHGFRALAMGCIKQELGYRHEVVDRQLAHQPKSKIDQAYDRADFMDERRVMMQEWANYIDKISSKKGK